MGTLAYRPDGPFYALELDREFRSLGHELSPLNLPLDSFSAGPRVLRSGDSPFDGGLPGLIADSLPDAWGERIPARAAREIYEEVEAATLGGWRDSAAYAGVPDKISGIWEKEPGPEGHGRNSEGH